MMFFHRANSALKRRLAVLKNHKALLAFRIFVEKLLLSIVYYGIILPYGWVGRAGRLGKPGWNENKISMADQNAFIVCMPVKMKDERHSLQDEIIRVAATSKTPLKLVYALLILIDRINPERKSASMRSDVYIMF